MAKEITYRCNLCGTKSDEAGKFVGIRFQHSGIEINAAAQENNHLCGNCVRQLKAAFGFTER